jgi:hypothetical protein
MHGCGPTYPFAGDLALRPSALQLGADESLDLAKRRDFLPDDSEAGLEKRHLLLRARIFGTGDLYRNRFRVALYLWSCLDEDAATGPRYAPFRNE